MFDKVPELKERMCYMVNIALTVIFEAVLAFSALMIFGAVAHSVLADRRGVVGLRAWVRPSLPLDHWSAQTVGAGRDRTVGVAR